MISLGYYAQLLLAHDWHYDRADDRRVYQQGKNEREWLRGIAHSSADHAVLYCRAYSLHR